MNEIIAFAVPILFFLGSKKKSQKKYLNLKFIYFKCTTLKQMFRIKLIFFSFPKHKAIHNILEYFPKKGLKTLHWQII